MRVHVKVPASAVLWVIQPAGARQRKGDHNATGESDRGRRHRRPRIAPTWGRGRALRKSAPGRGGTRAASSFGWVPPSGMSESFSPRAIKGWQK
jgi:hypothetical protein